MSPVDTPSAPSETTRINTTVTLSSPATAAEVGKRVEEIIAAHKGPLTGMVTVFLESPQDVKPTGTTLNFEIAGAPTPKPGRMLIDKGRAVCNAEVIEHAPGVLVFRLRGSFTGDEQHVKAFRDGIIETIGDADSPVAILNCADMQNACSDGVFPWLITYVKKLKEKNGCAAITNRPPNLTELITMTKFDKHCHMFNTEEEALQKLRLERSVRRYEI